MSAPRPHSSFWDQDCDHRMKEEEETQARLLGSILHPPYLESFCYRRSLSHQCRSPHNPVDANPTMGPPQSTLQPWGLDRHLGCRQGSPDVDAPQCPSRTLWDCKTEKPAQPGQQSPGTIWAIRTGQSPLQQTTPSSSAPGCTLICGSTSTRSQGTQLEQPQPHTSSP